MYYKVDFWEKSIYIYRHKLPIFIYFLEIDSFQFYPHQYLSMSEFIESGNLILDAIEQHNLQKFCKIQKEKGT